MASSMLGHGMDGFTPLANSGRLTNSAAILMMTIAGLLLASACQSGSDDVIGFVPDPTKSPAGQDVGVRFVDVADDAGLKFSHFNAVRTSVLPEDMGSGAAWGDFDGDGLLDLFVVNASLDSGAEDTGKLFNNLGEGAFGDVTESSGIRQTGLGLGALWFDFDGDRDLDLFITEYGRQTLYRNAGGGVFEDATESSGLTASEGWPAGAAVADYDMDGDLDLYVPHYVAFEYESQQQITERRGLEVPLTLNPLSYDPLPNSLYRNNGDGTFIDVAEAAGVANPGGRSLQAVFADLNLDGLPDLYVANDTTPDFLFVNGGSGTFENVAEYARTSDARASMGVAIGDYDRDLDWDLWITHWIAQDDALFRNMVEPSTPADMRFIDRIASDVGEISVRHVGFGIGFIDYDNDGWLDAFVANGSTFEEPEDETQLRPMRNLLFRNRGGGDMVLTNDVAGEAWITQNIGRGASFADYDNDGDMDILITAHGESVRLLENQGGNARNWLTFDLKGARGNTQAIGARITIGIDGVEQAAEVIAGSSYLSMNDTRLHFGLGDSATVDWVEIRWPDGRVQRLQDVSANQFLVVAQSEDSG